MVAEDLPAVTQAFLDGRGDMATALAQREQFVDALYRQVEELAGRELLLQAPVASDLRFLLSVLRIAPELERSHDLVMQLTSHVGPSLAEYLTPAARDLAERWETSPPPCGAKRPTHGTTATAPPRLP